jgi:hypothetical protein
LIGQTVEFVIRVVSDEVTDDLSSCRDFSSRYSVEIVEGGLNLLKRAISVLLELSYQLVHVVLSECLHDRVEADEIILR